MYLTLTIWETGPTLYFTETQKALIQEIWGPAPCLKIVVDEGTNRVFFGPIAKGPHILKAPQDPIPYWLISQQTDFEGPRCGKMSLAFVLNKGVLQATLPLPHERPWPSYCEYEDKHFNKHTAIVREIRLRQDSLEQAEGHRNLALPALIQTILTSSERVRYFQERKI